MNREFYKYISYIAIIFAVLPLVAVFVPGMKIPIAKLSYSTVFALLAIWSQREYKG